MKFKDYMRGATGRIHSKSVATFGPATTPPVERHQTNHDRARAAGSARGDREFLHSRDQRQRRPQRCVGRGGGRRFRTWHAQRHPHFQLHVERTSPRHLSRWRFTGVRLKRTADRLRTDRRWSARFGDADENVVSRKRPRRDLSRNGCKRWRGAAEWIALLAFWEGLASGRWRLATCRPLGACR